MKIGGLGVLLSLLLPLLIVYLFTPLYIIQFVLIFLFLLVLGSRMYSEYLLRSIVVRRRDTELRAFRYQWVSVELVAENYGRLPVFMFGVKDDPGMLTVFRDNKIFGTLRGRSRIVFTWQGYCSSRGVFVFGPARIWGQDPLGFFPVSFAADETATLFVYPALGMAALRSAGGIPQGTLLSSNPLYEDLTRSRSLREYHPGDEVRRINWKAGARFAASTGEFPGQGAPGFMVNEYESTVSYPLVIFLNLDPYDYSLRKREPYIERVIEAGAALCLMAARERQELGIILYTPFHTKPVSVINPAAFTLIPILERLAALERAAILPEQPPEIPGADPSAPALRNSVRTMLEKGKHLPYGSRFVYAGPDLTDEEYGVLNSLKRYHLTPEYLVIDERTLPQAVPGNSRRYQIKETGYEII
jgi:uncharacterized protein (DUF58 family)